MRRPPVRRLFRACKPRYRLPPRRSCTRPCCRPASPRRWRLLCAFLYGRYRKPYFAWWAAAWGLYLVRIGAITSFLLTGSWIWLYWHQVVTGWTALALLYAALVFSQRVRWRPWYLALVLFPPVWSYVAIYRLDHFLWAAGPAVLFLSLATLWTGWVFLRYRRRVRSSGATLLAVAFVLWGLHHLDYPFLRARGAWTPWGYYLDILFSLAVGAGILLLVLDDLRRGLSALSALSGDLQQAGREQDVLAALLARPLTLPAVRGSALFLVEEGRPRLRARRRRLRRWERSRTPRRSRCSDARARHRPAAGHRRLERPGRGRLSLRRRAPAAPRAGAHRARWCSWARRATRSPRSTTAFLVALGQQVGAALENADLYRRLAGAHRGARPALRPHGGAARGRAPPALPRAARRDGAGVLRGQDGARACSGTASPPAQGARLDQVLALIDTGIRSIRNVTNDLRPSLLDDLGLLPALRSLVADFAERSGIRTRPSPRPAALPAALEGGGAGPVPRAAGGAVERAAARRRRRRVEIGLVGRAGGCVLLRCGTTGAARRTPSPSGSSVRATWAWPACGSASARWAGAYDSAAPGARRAALEVLLPVDGAGRSVSDAVIRVLVADDHAIVRTGIRHVLETEPGFAVVGEAVERRRGAGPGARAPARRRGARHLDARACSGLRVAAELRRRAPETRILILSMHDNTEYVLESLRAGVHGYLLKDSAATELRGAIRAVWRGESFFSPAGRPPARRRRPGRARGEPRSARWPSSPPGSGRC